MIKSNKRIVIVRSMTKGLSSMSQVSCDAVLAVLARHFTTVGISTINDLSDLEALVARDPDLVFLGMEFVPENSALGMTDPNKIWLSDFLDKHEIAYTGSSRSAHELARYKPLAKQYVLDAGLRTSAYCVVKHNQSFARHDIPLAFPLFVKPTNRGGGLGIDSKSVVYNFEQLCSKVDEITTKFQTDALIEGYLPGREFSVAILKKNEDSNEFLAMPIELIAPSDSHGVRILSGKVKSSNSEMILQVTDEIIKSKVTKLALDAFYALGARDYGRIDIRLDAAGVPHFLEANLMPSLISGYGSFPKACIENIGLEYEPMILKIVRLGLARNINDSENTLESVTMNHLAFSSAEAVLESI